MKFCLVDMDELEQKYSKELSENDNRYSPELAEKDINYRFERAVTNDHNLFANKMLNEGRIDPSINNNEAIRDSFNGCQTETLKLLLNDKKVDPTFISHFEAYSMQDKCPAIFELLLKDKRFNQA